MRTFAWTSLFLALIFTPIVYGYGLYLELTDDVQCTDDPPLPQTWAEFVFEISVVFLICLVCACLLVFFWRFFSWYFSKTS